MKLYINQQETQVIRAKFPAGESLIRIVPPTLQDPVATAIVQLDFRDNGDLIELMLLMDAFHRLYPSPLIQTFLIMHYLPYARQDRVCNHGESLSVKVIADLINSLKFSHVYCMNIHSEVGVALLNNLVHLDLPVLGAIVSAFPDKDNVVLVSPDAGANKKVFAFAKQFGYPEVVRADKIRNVLTGDIVETKVYAEHIGNKDFLIMDDICDGGRTFIELAKELRKLTNGKIYLYVTHGIFSKGAEVFEGLLDGIYTSNLMGAQHQLVKEI
jgi:ribose-phosphate pyrophosphokinase